MKRTIELDRRKVLGTVGGLAMAGSGMAFFAGSAAASVNTNFTANNAGTVTTPDGSVREVMVDTSGTFSWSGFDSPADSAVVTLEAKKHGVGAANYSELASESYTINGLSGSQNFSLSTVDLTEHFGDDHFETDTDGELTATWIDLRVSVEITSADGTTHDASAADSMKAESDNVASDANINGESDASASSYDQAFASHGGDSMLYITYGQSTYTFHLDVSDWGSASSGQNANWNLAINLDAAADDYADFQVSRKPDGSVEVTPATSSNAWGSGSAPSSIQASATDDGTLTVEVAASEFGSTYSVIGQATAGGEYAETRISNTEGKAFNAPDWDASDQYYITVNAP